MPEPTEERIGLHNLTPAPGSRRPRKRVGRGEGSGTGTEASSVIRARATKAILRNRRELLFELGAQFLVGESSVPHDLEIRLLGDLLLHLGRSLFLLFLLLLFRELDCVLREGSYTR